MLFVAAPALVTSLVKAHADGRLEERLQERVMLRPPKRQVAREESGSG